MGRTPSAGSHRLMAPPLDVRPSGSAASPKRGLSEMWSPRPHGCDLLKQQREFYDSVWRDAVRLEAIVNYEIYLASDLKSIIDFSDYAVDDGIISSQMARILTSNTDSTYGAQYDDIMWWALAYLRAYEHNPAHRAYLEMAKRVFVFVQKSPDREACDGGVVWGNGTNYKNAITNSLYLTLAARLAGLSSPQSKEREEYLRAAMSQADWLLHSSIVLPNGLLGDGIHYREKVCPTDISSTVWTYSQGVAISGLAELGWLSGNRRYADAAEKLLLRVLDPQAAPTLLSPMGIIEEVATTPAKANEDMQTFKGIFVRHLAYGIAYLAQLDKQRYATAIQRARSVLIQNANAVWQNREYREDGIAFSFDWADAMHDPSDPANLRTTTAAIDLFNAAWSIKDIR